MNAPDILVTDDGRQTFEPDGWNLQEFLLDRRFVSIIQGPLGSGKSRLCCARIMYHAQQQEPSRRDGLRKSRWAIVRNTFPDLKRTTIRTWLEVFPESLYGRFFWGQPPAHNIKFDDVRLECDFLALDKPEDVRKLRSGEYTGIWFNEVQYIPKELFDEATSRVDRYPAQSEGGPTWTGVIADCNAPEEDHWLALMTGQIDLPEGLTDEERAGLVWPQEWGFYMQPPALLETFDAHGVVTAYRVNPDAENQKWLSPQYYQRQVVGKSRAWIDSRLMNRVTIFAEGSAVWPMFRPEFHVSREVLQVQPGIDVWVGMDFGRQPAAVFAQQINNRVFHQHELIGFNEGATTFAPKVKRLLDQLYPGSPVHIFGDPKGRDKGQTDERTAYEIFAANGMIVQPAPVKNNMIETRIEAVGSLLNDNPSGIPRFVLSPRCRTLKAAMAGKYYWKGVGSLREPEKNKHSHIADAEQYLALGLGEGRVMTGRPQFIRSLPLNVNTGRKSRRRV
jgi:hypothetical protein